MATAVAQHEPPVRPAFVPRPPEVADAVPAREPVSGKTDPDAAPAARRRAGSPWSAEDLAARIGDIPLDRVRFDVPPGTATVADAVRISETDRPCELIDGVLVEKAMGFWEADVGMQLGRRLSKFADECRLGRVLGSDGMIRVRPEQVRMPDVAFYSWERLPTDREDPCPTAVPDLAVEVLSIGNTRREMTRKRAECFAAGTREVWIVDPRARTVEVFRSDTPEPEATLREGDLLSAGEWLAGFTLPVAELFATPQRPVPPQSASPSQG